MIRSPFKPKSDDQNLPPGPTTPLPRFARPIEDLLFAGKFARNSRAVFKKLHAEYGETFAYTLQPGSRWVFVSNPDDIKKVFLGGADVMHAGKGNDVLLPLLGPRSVLLLDGKEHLRQRKLLLPPFHGQQMNQHRQMMRDAAQAEMAKWPRNKPIQIWPSMQAVTLEVILSVVFGPTDQAEADDLRKALKRVLHLATSTPTLMLLLALGPQRIGYVPPVRIEVNRADKVIYRAIRRRRQQLNLESRSDVLSMLICARDEAGQGMTDEELRDELMTLLVAGHETTATSLSWAIERLVRTPNAYRSLTDELDQTAAEERNGGAYLDAVIKETLRVRPVLHLVVRELQSEFTVGGYTLPKGTRVAPCIYLAHQNPDLYPDPEAFNPDRWLDMAPETYSWIPFGGGVRRCLGSSFAMAEMQEVLAEILSTVKLQAAKPEDEKSRRRAITHTPADRCRVIVSNRSYAQGAAAAKSLLPPVFLSSVTELIVAPC